MTVWIYVDTSEKVGDKDHLKVFANEDAAEIWFKENDPEGVAFEHRRRGPSLLAGGILGIIEASGAARAARLSAARA